MARLGVDKKPYDYLEEIAARHKMYAITCDVRIESKNAIQKVINHNSQQ